MLCLCVKENQLDAQFIVSIFHQTPPCVSDVSTVHLQEVHRMFKQLILIVLFRWLSVFLPGLEPSQDSRHSSEKDNHYQLL